MKPLRVAMLARAVWPLHGYGGIERHIYHLTTHLVKRGLEVTLFVQDSADTDGLAMLRQQMHVELARYDYTSPYLRPNSILGRQINYPRYTLAQGAEVVRRVRNGEFDIVHSQGLCAFGYGWHRRNHADIAHVPFFANPHGLEEYRTPDWRKWLAYAPFRWMYTKGHQLADYVIATDACTAPDLPKYLDVNQQQVVVIPSAIDINENLAPIRPERIYAMRQRFAAHDELLILSVSRLERNKGYHLLAQALQQAVQRELLPPTWRWVLVGDGKERSALAAQVAELGIAQHVTFAGRIGDEDLQNLYAAADFFVHPTLYEGSSLVTLEAMIHQRPVLATAAGGIPDKIFNNVNGILISPGSVSALFEGLSQMLRARADWPSWGVASAEIVRQQFDWSVVARHTHNAYIAALDARRSHS
jgi:glycosyltransferase involved in cell wall biosynthesis